MLLGAHGNWFCDFEFLSLVPCSKLCLVLQVSWLCPKSIATAWTPKTIPFDEYLTYLAALLAACISAGANWFLSFMAYAYSFTGHSMLEFIFYILRLVANALDYYK